MEIITPKVFNGKVNTYPDRPNTTISVYLTPRRKQALIKIADKRGVHYGCLVTDAIEAAHGAELDAIEATLP